MFSEWKQTSTVQSDGKIEITVPGASAGQVVEVSVRFEDRASSRHERPIGSLKGQIKISPDFDAPLEEFDEYT